MAFVTLYIAYSGWGLFINVRIKFPNTLFLPLLAFQIVSHSKVSYLVTFRETWTSKSGSLCDAKEVTLSTSRPRAMEYYSPADKDVLVVAFLNVGGGEDVRLISEHANEPSRLRRSKETFPLRRCATPCAGCGRTCWSGCGGVCRRRRSTDNFAD